MHTTRNNHVVKYKFKPDNVICKPNWYILLFHTLYIPSEWMWIKLANEFLTSCHCIITFT